jgi:energy-coupling factor transporter transmembrane protein EcfT
MSLGPWEIALIFLFIIIVFGGKKLPEIISLFPFQDLPLHRKHSLPHL